MINYELFSLEIINNMKHLVALNTLISLNERIPGLSNDGVIPQKLGSLKTLDLVNPVLPIIVDKLRLSIPIKFDSLVIRYIRNNIPSKHLTSFNESAIVRKITCCFHNTWTFQNSKREKNFKKLLEKKSNSRRRLYEAEEKIGIDGAFVANFAGIVFQLDYVGE
jgi:hypothetical protein